MINFFLNLILVQASILMSAPIDQKVQFEINRTGAKVSKEDVLALVEVESCFNPEAKKGKYLGLLQLGPSYMKESGYPYRYAKSDIGSIQAFLAVQKKYEKLLSGPPESVAIFHKGGPGTLRTYLSLFATGMGRDKALEATTQKHKNIGDLKGFVKRWEAAKNKKGWWCK